MRPMYASNTVAARDGNYLILTFENAERMIRVKVSERHARALIDEMQMKLGIKEPDGNNREMCEHRNWPYTETNICTLPKGHTGEHIDARDRVMDW